MADRRTEHMVLPSPLGLLTLVARGGAMVALCFEGQRHAPAPGEWGDRIAESNGVLGRARTQLSEYLAGTRASFDLPVTLSGTPFQRSVYDILTTIDRGQTTSYGTIAQRLALASGSARAVGAAVGRNPLPVIVPCHRVVGADGTLTGYAGGLERKVWLLRHEGLTVTGNSGPLARAHVHG